MTRLWQMRRSSIQTLTRVAADALSQSVTRGTAPQKIPSSQGSGPTISRPTISSPTISSPPACATTRGLPSQGLGDMSLDQRVSGRTERRLPIIVVVRLTSVERGGTDGEERTYTDNISARGARIFSKHPWQPGGEIMVTPRNEETTCGSVVYCQRLDDRYAIGVKFQDCPATWSAIRRYDGILLNPSAKPKSSE